MTRKRSARLAPAPPTNRTVDLSLVKSHPDNYNQHPAEQLAALQKSVQTLGQFRSLVLWEQEDGSFIQLAGHGVVEAMRARGEREARADVYPPTLDPLVAKQILLADNLHARNSEPDEDLLARLLSEQQDYGVDLEMLGSSEEMLHQMLEDAMKDAPEEPMPDPGDAPISEISEQWALIVTCRDEEQQLELLERFQQEGLPCRVLIS